jgi:hypothetical protein
MIALFGELSLEEAMDLSQDRQLLEPELLLRERLFPASTRGPHLKRRPRIKLLYNIYCC